MGWELINGDPAPGSPESIQRAIEALTKVSTLASSAQDTLDQSVGALDVNRWKGTAADAFRANVQALPPRLGTVVVSYQEASTALSVFRHVLESAQGDASAALAAAQQATDDRQQAISRRDQAQQQVDALSSQERATSRDLASLQVQAAVTIDPTSQASLQQRIWATRAAHDRLRADRIAAQATRDRHAAAADAAGQRLDAARGRADQVRARIADAVSVAVTLLATAERDAHLPNLLHRDLTELKEALVTYGPVLIKSLQLAETLFQLAALVFPPGAGVFMLCAVVCGAGALVVTVGVDAATPGGLNKDSLLHLGVQALDVAASAVGLGSASKVLMVAKWMNRADEAANIGLAVKEGGVEGGLEQVGGMVIGHYGAKVVSGGVQKVVAVANKNPAICEALNNASRDIRTSGKILGIPLSDMQSRETQSFLASGHTKPGEFLPGNTARVAPSIRDHAVAIAPESGGLDSMAQDKLKSLFGDSSPAPPPQEIDINLPMPSSGGGW